jgi:phosphoribosylaminoimidazole-succinocarboxamide synthase
MEGGSLSDREIEDMGAALMKLEAKIRELAGHFGLTMADLNLELGPLGNLLGK